MTERSASSRGDPAASVPRSPRPDDSTVDDSSGGAVDDMGGHQHGRSGESAGAGGDPEPSARELLFLFLVACNVVVAFVAGFIAASPVPGTSTAAPASLGRLTSPPSELPKVGSAVESRVTRDGRIVVTHWVRTQSPLTVIYLHRPRATNYSGDTQVTGNRMTSDGGRAGGTGDGTDQTFRLGKPAKLVRVTYALSGALERSSSVQGRTLVRTTAVPVTADIPLRGPVVVTVRAPNVLSLTCIKPERLEPSLRPCGAPVGVGWRVTLRGDDRQDQVIAQVDLRR